MDELIEAMLKFCKAGTAYYESQLHPLVTVSAPTPKPEAFKPVQGDFVQAFGWALSGFQARNLPKVKAIIKHLHNPNGAICSEVNRSVYGDPMLCSGGSEYLGIRDTLNKLHGNGAVTKAGRRYYLSTKAIECFNVCREMMEHELPIPIPSQRVDTVAGSVPQATEATGTSEGDAKPL
jgi:hypothetical protein